ncbi:MAG: type IV secretory system conjugative DNA transfer family protein [Clostridiaceae bacterium]|nr:type IV secretory system conjugative DNA transfer family protein [Clostridiaceae bacterium]
MLDGSGSGKSSAYSKPNAYQMLGSYIFTDPKGELYDGTAGYLKEHGYDIKVLNLVNPANSDGYNPLMHVSSELDVDVIANTVVKGQASESKSDPYWDDMAEMLLKSLIYYLIATRPEEEQNLASCSELVRAANTNGGSNLLTELINQLPYDHPARMYYKSIEIAPEKTYGSILSSLQSKLGKFDSKDIAEVTSTDTINFEDIGKKKTAVYVISSDTHTAYDFLLTIFFSQMIQQLYNYADLNGGRLQTPVFFILDEFANIGRIPDFDKKISTSRSRGIQFSVILQNLDQLEAIYEKSYETIIGNCDTHVFLGSNSYKTVEYFSKALGEKTIFRQSKSTNRDKHWHKQGYSDSEQLMARALMTPDELRRMDNDDCIIFEKGIKPVKARKYYHFTHQKMYKELETDKLDHNDFDAGVRGDWRKYNPYNPYIPETDKKASENLKVESLDDLFEEDSEIKEVKNIESIIKEEPKEIETFEIPELQEVPDVIEKLEKEDINLFDFEDLDTQVSNNKKEKPKVFDEDIQKELEAKFDELFGPMES